MATDPTPSARTRRYEPRGDRRNEEPTTPRSYAYRLASYISNPSTIRVRTLEYWGSAPSLDECAKIRAEVTSRQAPRESAALSAPAYVPKVRKPEPFKPDETRIRAIQSAPLPSILTPKDIIAIIARHFDLKYDDIVGRGRFRRYMAPRFLCVVILRERGGSLPQIARWVGRRDHSVSHNAIQKFPRMARDDIHLRNAYYMMRERLGMQEVPSLLAEPTGGIATL